MCCVAAQFSQLDGCNLNIILYGLVYGNCHQQNVYVAAIIFNYVSGSLFHF